MKRSNLLSTICLSLYSQNLYFWRKKNNSKILKCKKPFAHHQQKHCFCMGFVFGVHANSIQMFVHCWLGKQIICWAVCLYCIYHLSHVEMSLSVVSTCSALLKEGVQKMSSYPMGKCWFLFGCNFVSFFVRLEKKNSFRHRQFMWHKFHHFDRNV